MPGRTWQELGMIIQYLTYQKWASIIMREFVELHRNSIRLW